MSESSSCDVVVVGGGPGGALLAHLLASRGIETALIERQTDFEREFRGEVLMPGGLAMLSAAGFDIASVPHIKPTNFRGYRGGEPFFQFTIEDNSDPVPLSVSQPHLLEMLVAEAEKQPHFRFLRGTAVRDLLREGDRITGVRAQSKNGEEQIRARLVIGADGRASVVRRKQGLPARQLGTPMDIVWVKIPWPASFSPGQFRFYIGGGHLLIAFPAGEDGRLQMAWVILKGTYGELRSRGIEDWCRAMAEHVDAELRDHLLGSVGEIARPFLLDTVTDRVKGWARPGSLVIGDAAHTMSPVGGQGLNVAMRDAVVAANHLVPALRDGTDLDVAAARVESERGHEIDTIQRIAALPPRIMLGTRFFHSWTRALMTRVVNTSFGRSRAASGLGLFLNGTEEVRLEV